MGLLLLVLALFFAPFGLTSEQPRVAETYTVPMEDPSKPPELYPKRSTHNAPDG